MKNKKYKPGYGWEHLGGSVYDRAGLRLHLLGLIKFINKTTLYGNLFEEYKKIDKLIKINGGNRKRGLMAWARIESEAKNV